MAIFQSPKRPKFAGKSLKFRRKSDFAKFQAPKFEISEPEKMQFHTPSHSIPPLDSLLYDHRVVKHNGIGKSENRFNWTLAQVSFPP